MNRKALEWLYEQLPELVARGILTAENAERLREYYGPVVTQGGRTGLLIFGMIGALLVGLGLILIIGHNWDGFSRPVRAFIALGLLVAGQVVAGMALWFKAEQPAWLEGSAVFLQLAVGAGIALIGQTYHLTDDFSLYLLTWMLLTAPLVYLMTATAPAVIYLLGITCWLSTEHFSGIHKQWIWGLLALMLPHYWRLFQRDRYAGSTVLLSWLLPICIYFCVHLALGQYMKHTYPLVYSALFAITFFLGALWFDGDVKGWRQPLWNLGVAGGLGLAYIMSFKDFWESLRRNFRDGWWETGELFLTVTLLVVVSGLGFAVSRWRTGQYWLWGGDHS